MGFLLGLFGCASPDGAAPRSPDLASPFSPAGDEAVPAAWWTAFDDEALNRRIDLALTDNFSLLAAWERLQAARALARREGADLQPTLDGVASAAYRDHSAADGTEAYEVGLEAGYELDLWGGIRSRVEAEQYRASASEAAYQTAVLSLSAEMARAWYRLAEARSQHALLQEQIDTNLTVLEILQTRFAAGLIRSADVLRQRQLVEATREQAITVRARMAVLHHLLMVLEGAAPQTASDLPGASLPDLPPLPATGLPGSLVERRPDVRQAYALVAASDRELASAISARYPRVNLTASIRTAAERPEDLFSEWLSAVAGDAVAPLVAGGRLTAEIDRTGAVHRQRLAEYGQTVLTAFQEVEDALVLEANQRARLASLEQQLALASETYRQLNWQYLNGVTDYLGVLAALTARQELQRNVSTARLALVEFRIALYRALAGGFETGRESKAGRIAGGGPARG